MRMRKSVNISIVSAIEKAEATTGSSCSGRDMVALLALGDSMEPEFVGADRQ